MGVRTDSTHRARNAINIALDIFEAPLSQVLVEVVFETINKDVVVFFAQNIVVTPALLKAAIVKSELKASALPVISLIPRRRKIAITYFDLKPLVPIDSILDQCRQMYYATPKMIAVANGTLTRAWVEDCAVDTASFQAPLATLEDDLLLAQDTARLSFKNALDESSVTTGDVASKKMKTMLADLLITDDTFRFEEACGDCVSADGTSSQLQAKTLAILPTVDSPKDLATAVQEINLLMHTPLFSFSAKAAQNKVDDILTILSHLLNGNKPPITAEMFKCPFLKSALTQIFFFLLLHSACERFGCSGTAEWRKGVGSSHRSLGGAWQIDH
eukprot:TRINITY_DN29049_c0_g1_i1.p1 TRINITY_DN29049_c0_g1~~TRINITY_DN29049_c0_g1_i1.p1  ORF type:complete len:330 (+),score=50.52 TRINITY_DN29049_c0_g1_i1:782-1771(+)